MNRAGTLHKEVTTNVEDLNSVRKEVEKSYNEVLEQLERSKIELQNIRQAYDLMSTSQSRKMIDQVLDQKIALFRNFEAKQQEIIKYLRQDNVKNKLQGVNSQLTGLNAEINKVLTTDELLGLLVKIDQELEVAEQLKERVTSKIEKMK